MKLDLEERLKRAPHALDGADWLDVRRRAAALERERVRPRRRLALALVAALVVALVSVPAFGIADRLLGLFTVESETQEPLPPPRAPVAPRPYVYGDELFGVEDGPRALRARLIAPLLGQSTHLVVPSPLGDAIVYHAWEPGETQDTSPGSSPGTPVLRIHEIRSGDDELLARGAQSFAWSSDGRLAYFRATRAPFVHSKAYLGHVVVRESPAAPPTRWTTKAGDYTVGGCAGRYLLISSRRCLLQECDGLPADGVYRAAIAGRMQWLGLSSVSAISPDGKYVFGRFDQVPGQDSPTPYVRVVNVETAEVVAELDLRRAADTSVPRRWLALGVGEASWVGDRIVATATTGRSGGLVVLTFRDGRLSVDKVMRVGRQRGKSTHVHNPVLLGSTGEQVAVRLVELPIGSDVGTTRFLTCELPTGSCTRGRALPARRWLALAHNPSRPMPNGGFLPDGD